MSNYITIKLRRGTAAQWTATNPVLAEGEFGAETDTRKFKIGNGVTAWNSLQYWGSSGGGGAADFTDLGDVPPSYTGQGGKFVKVKSDESGLEFGTLTIAAGDLPTGIDAAKIADGTVSNTEFQTLNGASATFTSAKDSKLSGIEDNADVTDATNVNAAGAVMESDYNTAHSVLVQQSGSGSPVAVHLGNNTILGKSGGGDIAALSASTVRSLINVEDGADVTDAANVGSVLNAATAKTTPVDADTLPLSDSAAAGGLKKLSWANLKATAKAYFDTIYQAALGYTAANKAGDTFTGNISAPNLSGTNTGDQNLFSTIAVSGQSNVVADTTGDTLTLVAGANVTITTDASTDTITIAASGGGGGSVAWGGITGTLSDQTDLQTALDGKVDENAAITGATKTKITYDAKGLVTAGADAAIADITGLQTALDSKITAFADPNADRIVFWDDSAGAFGALTPSTGLTLSGTNLTVRTASATQTGIVELATDAETANGTATDRAVTPANIASLNLIGAATTATLTNKTFDANGTGNSLSNVEVADFAASAIVTAAETISSNNNDTTIPTSAAVKAYADSVAGGSPTWGSITGTLSSQTDLQSALDAKVTGFADPNADRIVFWDDSAGAYAALEVGSGLSISGTTLSATGGGGGGDVTVLAQSTTQTGPVNTTTETAIFSHTLPTDLAAGETLVLDIAGELLNNTGGGSSFEVAVKLGTTSMLFYSSTQANSGTKRSFFMQIRLFIDSTSSQKVIMQSWAANANTGSVAQPTTSFNVFSIQGYGTASEDTTSAKTFQVTVKPDQASANFYCYAEGAVLTRIAAP